jgi:hypothetical protein
MMFVTLWMESNEPVKVLDEILNHSGMRTFAWLGQARRLARDYERLPETGVAMIHWAMSRIMLRRLARTPA